MISSLKGEYETARELGADIIAISADSLDSHAAFAESMGGCPFPLASDTDLTVARLYDVVAEDGGHSVRAVFVLDKDGTVVYKNPWYQPGNMGHFMQIFEALGLE